LRVTVEQGPHPSRASSVGLPRGSYTWPRRSHNVPVSPGCHVLR
jgi:hypothetical protein